MLFYFLIQGFKIKLWSKWQINFDDVEFLNVYNDKCRIVNLFVVNMLEMVSCLFIL